MRSDRADVGASGLAAVPAGLGGVVAGSTAGLLVAAIEVIIATSFASLVFAGPLAGHVPTGIGMALVGAALLLVVTSLLTSVPTTIGSVQDSPVPILALVAASVAAAVGASDPATVPTVVMAVALATSATGLCFLALGTFRLGRLVRFLPYPVVGGFLAGTGWLVVRGSLDLLVGGDLAATSSTRLLSGDVAAVWVPGVAFAVALLVVTRRSAAGWVLPAAVALTVALFHATLALAGVSPGDAEATGWTLGPFPSAALWPTSPLAHLGQVRWDALLSELPNLISLVAVAVVAMLLNTSGIELEADRDDVDLDRELRASGAANLTAGAVAGFPGYHALSLTALSRRMGVRDRTAGFVAAGAVLGVLALGAGAVAMLPTAVVGGVLLFLGLGFLVEWLVDARSQLTRSAYAIVVTIVAVIATVGFLPGVAVGVAAALVLFAHRYSRTDIIKHRFSIASFRSNVDRPDHHRELLRAHGGAVHVLELQNFLFFGTAATLVDRILERIDDPALPPLRYLVLDLRRVPAVDTSAAVSLSKVQRLAARRGIQVVLTGLSDDLRAVLKRAGIGPGAHPHVLEHADLDRGVEWCEEQLLAELVATSPDVRVPLAERLAAAGAERADLGALAGLLERITLTPGQRLFAERDEGGDVYYLERGTLTVELAAGDATVRLRTMRPGTFVGELAFYLGIARTATVAAGSEAELLRLPHAALRDLDRSDPALAARLHRLFAHLLSERLTDSLRTIEVLLR